MTEQEFIELLKHLDEDGLEIVYLLLRLASTV